jgi:uncharacterized protein YqjF (DUF2071 family)
MLNYTVDPALLAHLTPAGTALDSFDGRTYVSLVGFRFERTRVRGLWIPFHSNFDEVNLRFYVRRKGVQPARRGVVFVKEIVPRFAIAKIARVAFGENYVALPMRHKVIEPTSEGGRLDVEYGWRYGANWNQVRVECSGRPDYVVEGSLEQFITEHYWGYAAQRDGGCLEYRVEHDRWRIWKAGAARSEGDTGGLYGRELAECLKREPDSAFLAEGSAVAVYSGVRL